jgi:hypothetical protein
MTKSSSNRHHVLHHLFVGRLPSLLKARILGNTGADAADENAEGEELCELVCHDKTR